MKKILLLLTAALPVVLSSCATSRPPQAYHNTDSSALIVQSLDASSCQVIAPTATGREKDTRLLEQARSFAQRQTAVVILENYSEPQITRNSAIARWTGLSRCARSATSTSSSCKAKASATRTACPRWRNTIEIFGFVGLGWQPAEPSCEAFGGLFYICDSNSRPAKAAKGRHSPRCFTPPDRRNHHASFHGAR